MNDPLGDMLTRIRNAQMRGKSKVISPASKLRCWVLDVLQADVCVENLTVNNHC